MKTNKTRSICVYTCTIYTYMHHQIPSKYDIPSWPSLGTLWKTRSNERSVLNQLFLLFFMCFSVLFLYFSWKASLFIQRMPTFMRKNKTRSICVYTCTIYTYMHHQIPPKYDLASWPSLCTLWKTRSKWEICVESAVFVVFQVLFMKSAPLFIQKVPLFMKTNKTISICVYTCTIYTYIHHIHHQIPPKYKIYLVGLPSVLYKTPGQNKRSVLNQLFLLLSMCFS